MPDDTLLDLAEKGELSKNLDEQVARMLADPRSSALVENFAMQWLQLRRIDFISPDGQMFPRFNERLRKSMIRETQLFFESIIREDRSIFELIDADYTFMNERLARHYDVEDGKIRGDEFVRVTLPDRTRGGLLTQASVLMVTSNPTRTSPVKRGKWVLEQILGSPPPPPPPDVPELEDQKEEIAAGTLRERLEIHRANPACANCHTKMDAIGFSLENYDVTGAWRTRDGKHEIDATGEFSDGTTFSGPIGLKDVVLERKDAFVRCFVEKMTIYATGRGMEYYDRPTINRILKELPKDDYAFSAVVREIVKSDAFRKRRGL